MLYCNYVAYLQQELGNGFIVSNTRNLNIGFDKVNVVITEMPGSLYANSARLGVQIDVYTSDPDGTATILNNFCASHNLSSFIENGYVIRQIYTTPSPFDQNIQEGADIFTRFVIIGTLEITFGVSSITSLKIDGEACEFLNLSIPYNTELHSMIIPELQIAGNRKKTAGVQLTFSCLHKETIFINKIRLIRTGALSGSTIFTIAINYFSGISETYTCMLQSATATFSRDGLPIINITMAKR